MRSGVRASWNRSDWRRPWIGSNVTARSSNRTTSVSTRCSTNSRPNHPGASEPKNSADMSARCLLYLPPCGAPPRRHTKEKTMPKPAEVTLPSDREVRVTRTFHAPRQLVWDAHTKPELVKQWQGFEGWDMPVCDMDVRVGGTYRWRWKNREDGNAFGFFGTFTE